MRDGTIYVAKTKALISFVVTTELICVFVFTYAKSRFSHEEAYLMEDINIPYNSIYSLHCAVVGRLFMP